MMWLVITLLVGLVYSQEAEYVIKAASLPRTPDGSLEFDLLPQVGNGHVAHVPFSKTVHMNGLFNGFQELSHRAKIPAFIAFNFTITAFRLDSSHTNITYKMNYDEAYFSQRVHIPSYYIDAELRVYANAHPQFGCLLVYDLTLTKLPGAPSDMEFDINLHRLSDGKTNDVHFLQKDSYSNIVQLEGSTTIPETTGSPPQNFHIFYTKPRSLVTFTSRDVSPLRFTFVQSVHYDEAVARRVFRDAIEAPFPTFVFQQHQSQCREVWWKHRVRVPNNPALDLLAQTSLYSLLTSIPSKIEMKHSGVGTDALGRTGQGLLSWAQEAWIQPVMTLLHPISARALIETRKRQWSKLSTKGKVSFPKLTGTGVKDLSDDCTRCTARNDCTLCKSSNDHVTAGVALGIKQYTSATSDHDLLKSGGYDVMADISRNFENRLKDNSEFVQLAGPTIMMYTYFSACAIGRHRILVIPERWRRHPEFHQKFGCSQIKPIGKDRRDITDARIDVPAPVLLFNWLPYYMKASQKRRILAEYEHSLRSQLAASPGYSALVSGWLDLGEEDKAKDLMNVQTQYVRGPFKIWYDSADESQRGTGDYLPAAAAYLQTLLFGYAGLRIQADKIDLNPRVTGIGGSLSLIGLKYVGSTYNIVITNGLVNMTMTRHGLVDTQYRLSSYDQWMEMKEGASTVFPIQAFTIRSIPSVQQSDCKTPDPMSVPACIEESENTGYTSDAKLKTSSLVALPLLWTLYFAYRSWL